MEEILALSAEIQGKRDLVVKFQGLLQYFGSEPRASFREHKADFLCEIDDMVICKREALRDASYDGTRYWETLASVYAYEALFELFIGYVTGHTIHIEAARDLIARCLEVESKL